MRVMANSDCWPSCSTSAMRSPGAPTGGRGVPRQRLDVERAEQRQGVAFADGVLGQQRGAQAAQPLVGGRQAADGQGQVEPLLALGDAEPDVGGADALVL